MHIIVDFLIKSIYISRINLYFIVLFFDSIAFEGRLLIIGFASGDIPKIPANILLVKAVSAVGVYWGSYRYIENLQR